jgi:uncharacterized protein (DUF1330 family)
MTVYLVGQINIRDRDEYRAYESGFMEIFSRYRGRLLSVEESPDVLEGSWPHTRTVLIEFPSKNEAMAWYRSEDYRKLAERRLASSEGNIILIKGRDSEESSA